MNVDGPSASALRPAIRLVSRAAWRCLAIASGMLSAIGIAFPENPSRQDRELQAEIGNRNISDRIEAVRTRVFQEGNASRWTLPLRIAQWFNFNNSYKQLPVPPPGGVIVPGPPGTVPSGPVPAPQPPGASGQPSGPVPTPQQWRNIARPWGNF